MKKTLTAGNNSESEQKHKKLLKIILWIAATCIVGTVIPIAITFGPGLFYSNKTASADKNYDYVGMPDGSNWKGMKNQGVANVETTVVDDYVKLERFVIENSDFQANDLVIPKWIQCEDRVLPLKIISSNLFHFVDENEEQVVREHLLYGTLTIPDSVTEIGSQAFSSQDITGNLVIPDSVTKIGDYAFCYCAKITNLILGKNVNIIGQQAFEKCSNLSGDLNIPNSVESIGNYAFYECHFDDIYLKPGNNNFIFASRQSVGEAKVLRYKTSGEDFNYESDKPVGCLASGHLTVPGTVEKISDGVFWGCASLTELTLNEGIKYIGDLDLEGSMGTFEGCSFTGKLNIPNSVESIGHRAFLNCQFNGNLEIPETVKTIGSQAFYICNNLTKLTLNEGIKEISGEAFSGINFTGELTIPSTLEVIGDNAFKGNKFTDINNEGDNFIFASRQSVGEAKVLRYKTSGEDFNYDYSDKPVGCLASGDLNIAGAMQNIPENMFAGCTALTSLTINASELKTINQNAFAGCTGITNLTLETSNLETIDNWAFGGCLSLTSINIPESVKNINRGTFQNCTSLTGTLTIPASVDVIAAEAFGQTNFTYIVNNSEEYDFVSEDIVGKAQILIKKGQTFNYATQNRQYAPVGCLAIGELTIPEGTESIKNNLFQNCNLTGNLIIPDSVKSIGECAFHNCNITSLTIGSSIENIDQYAFFNISSLNKITFRINPNKIRNVSFFIGDISSTGVIISECEISSKEILNWLIKYQSLPLIMENWNNWTAA